MFKKDYFDDLRNSIMDDMARDWSTPYYPFSFTTRGVLVNTDEYDIIPKPDKIKKDLQRKEQELANLKDLKKHAVERYDKQIESLEKDIKELTKGLNP